MISFADRLTDAVQRAGSPACVGLDPDPARLPLPLLRDPDSASREALAEAVERFCCGVLDEIAGLVPAVKPQVAWFEALGAPGFATLERVVAYARQKRMLVILDAKRGDIGSTARAYVRATLDDRGPLGADAVTVSPYLGEESLRPFLEATAWGKGLFVLVRTSNPGAGQWQVGGEHPFAGRVAGWISSVNAERVGSSGYGPVGAVVGATLATEAARWRAAMPKAWFLVPGYGAQGASADDCRAHGRDGGGGALIVSARGVLYGAGVERAGAAWRAEVRSRADDFVHDLSRLQQPRGGGR
ncbi:MAG: orotidine-5'-phosphate decarboxylase [Deltaproteobacteria bacterium]|nr:MAG: orotidine-5'-phosphate decarboxylase [Deltaproteobacteria bacterium]